MLQSCDVPQSGVPRAPEIGGMFSIEMFIIMDARLSSAAFTTGVSGKLPSEDSSAGMPTGVGTEASRLDAGWMKLDDEVGIRIESNPPSTESNVSKSAEDPPSTKKGSSAGSRSGSSWKGKVLVVGKGKVGMSWSRNGSKVKSSGTGPAPFSGLRYVSRITRRFKNQVTHIETRSGIGTKAWAIEAVLGT